ncbi:MAG TPA: hypothetical protein VIJ94_00935, partial [Caulobacteraceae bacterium]
MSDEAGIGHNKGPEGDAFAIALEERNQDLWRRLGDLEKRRLRMPKEPATEEEAATVTTYTADAKALARDFETRRVEVKQPYLQRGQLIDDMFNGQKRNLLARAEEAERRNGPYLRAKREAEEARRPEEARIARVREEEAERRAEAARQTERDAATARETAEREARAAEQQRLRDEETARQQAVAEAQQKAGATQRPVGIDLEAAGAGATAAADNEARMREAHQAEDKARRAREAAEEESRKAGVQAGRAERKADQVDNLGKVSAGGANQRASMVWVGKVDSFPKVLQSL